MSNLTESNNIISKIWEKICNQQGRDPDANDPDETIQSSDEDEIDLPFPEVSKLTQIKECFNTQNRMMRREKLSAALKDNSYIPKVKQPENFMLQQTFWYQFRSLFVEFFLENGDK